MIALVRFSGAEPFEKTVELEALPDVGDLVRVLNTTTQDPSVPHEPLAGVVTARTFSEMCYRDPDGKKWASREARMGVILDVQQA